MKRIVEFIKTGVIGEFHDSLHLKTAKEIGVTIPQSILYRADKVIK